MLPRLLPGTPLLLSPLGLGTVKFGRNQQVKYPRPFDLPSDADIHHLLDVAREGGINFLDTAPAYGATEERLGTILADRRGEDWIVATKAGEQFSGGASHYDFSPAGLASSVHQSLRRLRRERLDLLLLHSHGDDVAILRDPEVPRLLFQLKESGKVLAVGISTKTVAGGLLALDLGLDAVMAAYNPWHREEEPVLDAAAARGKGILIKKALGSGWLGTTPDPPLPPQDPVVESFQMILRHPSVVSIVAGTINPVNLRRNCQVVRDLLRQP